MRQVIVPTENTFLLHLPEHLVGKRVEVIAFSDDDIAPYRAPYAPEKNDS